MLTKVQIHRRDETKIDTVAFVALESWFCSLLSERREHCQPTALCLLLVPRCRPRRCKAMWKRSIWVLDWVYLQQIHTTQRTLSQAATEPTALIISDCHSTRIICRVRFWLWTNKCVQPMSPAFRNYKVELHLKLLRLHQASKEQLMALGVLLLREHFGMGFGKKNEKEEKMQTNGDASCLCATSRWD